MIDSHCHLHDARMQAVCAEALARARAVGVAGFVLAGVEPEGWRDGERLARAHPDVFVSYGVHPQLVADTPAPALAEMLRELERALTGVDWLPPVAVGEIGLDAYTPAGRACLGQQAALLRAQLALAREHDLPVILHVLKAHAEALAILEQDGLPEAGGVVHSYSGGVPFLPRYLTLGLHVGIAGPVTYRNASRALEVVRAAPLERLLVETDAPDQTPEPHRPAANEPAYLPAIVEAVARAKQLSIDEVAQRTAESARRLFRLPGA